MLAPLITTHVQDAVARLLSQYKDQPRIVALLSAFVAPIQDLENAAYALDAARSLFMNPTGEQLDMLGTLIGIERNGLSDSTYLSVLRGVIAEHYSDSSSETVMNAAASLFQARAIFRKVPNSVPPWPSLGVTPTIPAPPWTAPEGAVTSTLSAAVIGGVSQSILIQSADWPSFTPGGYIVLSPGQLDQEAYQFFSTNSPNIITPAGFPVEQYNHAIGDLVYYAPTAGDIPSIGSATPGHLYTQAQRRGVMATMALGIGSPQLDPTDYPVVEKLLLAAIPAAVGLFYLSIFRAEGAFACAGPQSWVAGWGTINDPSVGGPWASLLFNNETL